MLAAMPRATATQAAPRSARPRARWLGVDSDNPVERRPRTHVHADYRSEATCVKRGASDDRGDDGRARAAKEILIERRPQVVAQEESDVAASPGVSAYTWRRMTVALRTLLLVLMCGAVVAAPAP